MLDGNLWDMINCRQERIPDGARKLKSEEYMLMTKSNLMSAALIIVCILFSIVMCQTYAPSIKCHFATQSDNDETGQQISNGIIYCKDYKTGNEWKSEIDLKAAGLWREIDETTFDYDHNRLYLWAAKKTGGPGWRIFDTNIMGLLTPQKILARYNGVGSFTYWTWNEKNLDFERNSAYCGDCGACGRAGEHKINDQNECINSCTCSHTQSCYADGAYECSH
jgi:hypothetical protein